MGCAASKENAKDVVVSGVTEAPNRMAANNNDNDVKRRGSKMPEDKEASKRNREIDSVLNREKKVDQMTIKLLLLGGSESGKSTLAKQMKILHLNGFEEAELINFRCLIYSNIVDITRVLLQSVAKLNISIDAETESSVLQYQKRTEEVYMGKHSDDQAVYDLVDRIWKSAAVQELFYQRRHELQLPDNVEHFMTSLDRIGQPDYSPTNLDILYSRVATLGVHETKFDYLGKTFRLIDVGGQKSERRKWIHCFENVTAILFVAALNGYDQYLVEDNTVNRMLDSVHLFETIVNNQYFTKSSAILFLNKRDVFETKILQVPLTVCFDDYDGKDADDAKFYLKEKFLAQVEDTPPTKQQPNPQKRFIYTHFTNATDTKNVDVVFAATADVILKKVLGNVGVA